ncbi:MAG: F0F1 ATP synthase subunit alpha [Rickettsiales bacterium]|nr:F0F1 ATP synthase subunit alpha [Rickettsiales bacterium]
MFQDRVLEKFNNLLQSVSTSKIKGVNIEEIATVVEVNSYIVVAEGFTKISCDECVIINNRYFGIVSVIDRNIVKITLLDKTNNIKIGDTVKRTFKTLSVSVGDSVIGRVVDGLGRAIDDKGKIETVETLPVERPAVDIINRQSVKEPIETGIKVIDSLIPIGRGQRELILGDRQTGKTSIAIDAILNQKNSDVICIYCSIGQRDSSMANILKTLKNNGAMSYTVVVHAGADEMAGQRFIAPYTATSIGEYFMNKGKHVLIVYDDLSKHAKAYREISLLLEKNPGREAYPADIFYIHSRLLERSTKMKDEFGGGSITSLPIIETEAENMSAYIPTNVISITDGQIYLSPSLFRKGVLPAVDVSKSVSRVGSSAQLPAYKQAVATLGIEYSQFEELESFSKFSTSLDETTEKIINRGYRIREFLKQRNGNTLRSYEQVAILLCLNAGIFDDVDVVDMRTVQETVVDMANKDDNNIRELVENGNKLSQEVINNFIMNVKVRLEKQNG